MSGTEGFGFIPPTGQEPETEPDESQIFSDFLKNVPDEEKPVVQKYLAQIQGGVTKRFQSIHDEYRPYKEIAGQYDPEILQRALGVWDLLDQDPKRVYDILKTMAQENQWEPDPNAQPPKTPPHLQGLPEEFTGRFNQMEQLLMTMGQEILSSRQEREAAAQDQQLDDYMNWLKTTHGEFDEPWVLSRMEQGVDGQEAVKQYQAFEQSILTRAGVGNGNGGKPTPRVLGGAGSVPMDRGLDLKNASDQDVRNHIVAMLNASHQS